MKINSGRFYRFRESSTIYMVMHIWPATPSAPEMAEVAIINQGTTCSGITYQRKVDDLVRFLSCEVSPTWLDVDGATGDCYDPAAAHAAAVAGAGNYVTPGERQPEPELPAWLVGGGNG